MHLCENVIVGDRINRKMGENCKNVIITAQLESHLADKELSIYDRHVVAWKWPTRCGFCVHLCSAVSYEK